MNKKLSIPTLFKLSCVVLHLECTVNISTHIGKGWKGLLALRSGAAKARDG